MKLEKYGGILEELEEMVRKRQEHLDKAKSEVEVKVRKVLVQRAQNLLKSFQAELRHLHCVSFNG